MIIQIVTAVICGVLFAWGGYNWNKARRFIMPVVLAAACAWLTHSWWSLSVLACSPMLCLGYGDKAPLTHIFNTGWSRSVWGLIVALGASVGLFYAGFLPLWSFILYLALGFTLDNVLKNLNQIAGDFIVGCFFASFIFFVH